MPKRSKLEIFLEILQEAGIVNEAGHVILDFENQGRDALDFASVSRQQLFRLIDAAFDAGIDYEAGIN